MENSIVVFLGSVALVMIIFTIALYFGKKYHYEELRERISKNQASMLTITRDVSQKDLEKHLDLLRDSHIKSVGIMNKDETVDSVILTIEEYEKMKEVTNSVDNIKSDIAVEKNESLNDLVEIEIDITPSIEKNLLKLESTTDMSRELIITTALEEYLDSFKK